MKKDKLALFGGNKIIKKPFKKYNTIGEEELNAVTKVIKKGILSKYLARWGDDFEGGPKVKTFENLERNTLND